MQFKCKTSLHDLRGRVDIAKYMVYIIFLCTIGLFAIWLGDTFFSLTNILNITRQTAMISVMAVAMVFVIATGGIDLTVSGVVPISGLLCAIVLEKTDNMFAGIAVALLVGTLIGAINGTFITYMKIPAFLMTLGMQFALKGVAMWISDTKSVPIYHKTFNHIFGYSAVFGIPVLLIWTIVFVIIGVILLRLRPFGRKVLAVGGNATSAKYSGIKVNSILIRTYMFSGFCAAVAGLLYAGRTQAAKYTYGENDEMSIIAAVVLGGTAMTGGTGSIVGAFVGSMLMGMINNGLIMGGLGVPQQKIVRGLIIIVAVTLNNISERRKTRQ